MEGLPLASSAIAASAGLRLILKPKLSLDAACHARFAPPLNDHAAQLSLSCFVLIGCNGHGAGSKPFTGMPASASISHGTRAMLETSSATG
jgi:hypothetical protein